MITTAADTIRDGMQMAGRLSGLEMPTPAEEADALRKLQTLILSLPGMMHWTEVETTADYTAGENERVRVVTNGAVTVSIPVAVSSADQVLWCCDRIVLYCTGNDDRAPKDGAKVAVADAYSDSHATYFYRADLAQWVSALDLTRDSRIPLNADMDRFLSALLAAEINPIELNPIVAALVTEGRERMRARYDLPRAAPRYKYF